MRPLIAVSIALLFSSGCAPLTGRLDLMNQQIGTTNAQLAEANQRLGDSQAKLAEANQRIDETNRRLAVIDQAILKFPGLRPAPGTPAAAAPTP